MTKLSLDYIRADPAMIAFIFLWTGFILGWLMERLIQRARRIR